jgi:hypothetical protein
MLHGPAIYLCEKRPGANGVEVCRVPDLTKSKIFVHDVESDIRNMGLVNWREVARDSDGWRTETRETPVFLE